MVGIISRRNGIPVSDLVFAFGQFMFPAFYDRYPQLIDGHANMLDFLEGRDSCRGRQVVPRRSDPWLFRVATGR